MKQRLLCITAAQRSGTTALQRAIAATTEVVNFGEIFHSEPLADARGSFRQFATENELRLLEASTGAEATAIAQRYLAWLREQAAPRHLLLDLKLNSWFALSGWWQYPHHEPLFLTQLKRADAALIFIWRQNLADQVLSQFISSQLGVWHNVTAAQVAGRTIKAPVERMRKLANLIVLAEADMHRHLRDYPSKIVIRYEDLFVDGKVSKQFRRAFQELVQLNLPEGAACEVRPNRVRKREIVENYDEVIGALAPLAESRSLLASP